jgi:Mrp family chromosome partitioning ATPase
MKFIGFFLALAAGLGVGSTILAEAMDRRIRNPNDLERTLGIPPLAWLAERTSDATTRLAEDQLRRMALSLAREHRVAGVSRCVLTGVQAGSGVTTLIDQLGVELLSVGLKVLTVDGNALGTVEVEGRAGLIDLLESDVDPHTAIVKGTPNHLPLGASTGLRRLPAAHRLNELFERLGQEYDMILVDAPPLLLSSDAELLVASCDATLLIVGAEQDDSAEVKKTLAVLERLAPPSVGLVLNRVRVRGKLDEVQGAIREPRNWS